jgi:hypothetical protein
MSRSTAGEPGTEFQTVEDAVPQKSWRDVLAIHLAAQLFERMGPDELKVLGEDIKANGMKMPITILRQEGKPDALLDGQNRLDGLDAVGLDVPALIDACMESKRKPELQVHYVTEPGACSALTSETVSPYAYVRSVNVNRRHLAPAKKAQLIEQLLKENPERSDRAIAKDAKADHKTIAARRQELVATGEIPPLEKRTGADGKRRRQLTSKSTERSPYGGQKKPAAEVTELTKQESLFGTMRGGGIEDYPYRSPNREGFAEPPEPPEDFADSGATIPAPQWFPELKVESSSESTTPIVWVEIVGLRSPSLSLTNKWTYSGMRSPPGETRRKLSGCVTSSWLALLKSTPLQSKLRHQTQQTDCCFNLATVKAGQRRDPSTASAVAIAFSSSPSLDTQTPGPVSLRGGNRAALVAIGETLATYRTAA